MESQIESKLLRIRRERKQLEDLESEILASPARSRSSAASAETAVPMSAREDTQSMHAWAARELKSLSESIRRDQSDIELQTARQKQSFDSPPLAARPSVVDEQDFEFKDDAILRTAWKKSMNTQSPVVVDPGQVGEDVIDEVEDCVSTRSESVGVSHVGHRKDASWSSELVLKDLSSTVSEAVRPFTIPTDFLDEIVPAMTSSRNMSDLSVSKLSLLADDSIFLDIRGSSPEPYAPVRTVEVSRISNEEDRSVLARDALDEYIEEENRKREKKLSELRQVAMEMLGHRRVPEVQSPLIVASDDDDVPPLATIKREKKGGVAMQIDIAGFR